MILGLEALLEAEKKGHLRITDREDFSALSIDIKLGRLYRNKKGVTIEISERYSDKEYLDRCTDEIEIPHEGMQLNRNDFYLWQPVEEITMEPFLSPEVITRSSWARLGIMANGVNESFIGELDKPLLNLKTFTDIWIKPEDKFAQLVVRGPDPSYVSLDEFRKLMDTTMVIKNTKRIYSKDAEFHGNMVLKMGEKILKYNGTMIVPGEDNDAFDSISLDKPIIVRKGNFFLSSSAEKVSIPEDYVGYVSIARTHASHALYNSENDMKYRFNGIMSNPNAPLIGPRNIFKGNITFENYTFIDSMVNKGMFQSEFYLQRLCGNKGCKESRYKEQEGTTESRL